MAGDNRGGLGHPFKRAVAYSGFARTPGEVLDRETNLFGVR